MNKVLLFGILFVLSIIIICTVLYFVYYHCPNGQTRQCDNTCHQVCDDTLICATGECCKKDRVYKDEHGTDQCCPSDKKVTTNCGGISRCFDTCKPDEANICETGKCCKNERICKDLSGTTICCPDDTTCFMGKCCPVSQMCKDMNGNNMCCAEGSVCDTTNGVCVKCDKNRWCKNKCCTDPNTECVGDQCLKKCGNGHCQPSEGCINGKCGPTYDCKEGKCVPNKYGNGKYDNATCNNECVSSYFGIVVGILLAISVIGIVGLYWFAKKTVSPIEEDGPTAGGPAGSIWGSNNKMN